MTYTRLTRKGFRLIRDSRPVHRAAIRRPFLDHVAPDQLEAVGTALGAIVGEAFRR